MTQQHPGNLRLSPEVGIRSLKDLTKDELIYCINNACTEIGRASCRERV